MSLGQMPNISHVDRSIWGGRHVPSTILQYRFSSYVVRKPHWGLRRLIIEFSI